MRSIHVLILCLAGAAIPGSAPAQTIRDGLLMEVVYTGDVVANVAGGLERGVRYMDNLDISLALDGDVIGWTGGGILLYGIGNQGGSITPLVGDAQVVNNIEAPTNWRLFEAWLEQSIDDRASFLIGLYDVNSEFDVNRTGSVFVNSSHGTGLDLSQSGVNGPSIFPVTSLGVRARVGLSDWLELRAAAVDGVPGDPDRPRGTRVVLDGEDGLLLISEIEIRQPSAGHRLRARKGPRRMVRRADVRARVAFGAWTYTKPFERIDGSGRTADSRGVYVIAEGKLFRESEITQGLSAFFRGGAAQEVVNRFGSYVGFGFVYTGPFRNRDADQLGIGVAVAINGDPFIEANTVSPAGAVLSRTETNIELTYAAAVSDWLSVQADLQYVVNPDTRKDTPDALVPTVRFMVAP